MPTVSVIIPSYNHAPYLRQRIESVLEQTYPDFELIILDDCSTDGSNYIIDEYNGHPKISHIAYNDVNSGSTFKQWQKGIALAKGKYIWIAESDDYADPRFLEYLIVKFDLYPDLILSYCQSTIVDEKGDFIRIMDWADALDNDKWKNDYVEAASAELRHFLNFRNTISNASAVVFKNPNNLNILTESTEMRLAGDWLFWRKLLSQAGKIAYCSTPLNNFRMHSQTTRSVTTKSKELVRLKEYKKLIVGGWAIALNDKYDWMIFEWYINRRALKGSLSYYIPRLPAPLIIRYLVIIYKFVVKKATAASSK